MKRVKEKKKKGIFWYVIIGVVFLVLVFVGVIGYSVYNDLQEEKLLKQEIINLSNKNLLTDNFDIYVKTTGDYAYVEEAIKTFYKELADSSKVISNYMADEELLYILKPEQLNLNRPNFDDNYKKLDEVQNQTNEAIKNISSLCDEEKIKNLIDREKVDDYYIDLYEKLMYTEDDLEDFHDTKVQMEKLSLDLNAFLNKIREILDMLKNNNSSWEVENGTIYFNSDSLVNEYNKLYYELQDLADNFDTDTSSGADNGISA